MKRDTRVKGEAAALLEDSLSHRFDEKSCGLQRANGIRQADQNGHPTRPQPMATPQAYPLGYVEDVAEVRTPLGIVFISLLGFGATEATITIARFWRQLKAPIGEKIFRQVGPRSTA